MARGGLGKLLLAMAMMAGATGAGARPPAVASHTATYDFYVGGIWAGAIAIDAESGAGTYRAGVSAHTAGIVGFFFDAGVEAETVGRIDATGLSPVRFTADSHERRHRQMVEIAYEDATPAAVMAKPAYRIRPWSISPSGQVGTVDPLSAAFQSLTPAPAEAICNQTAVVFDGARRWAIEFGPPDHEGGAEGGRIGCDAAYVRIAGFKPTLMGDRARRPFRVFFEDRGDGLYHIVRVAGKSWLGLAVLLLRE